jgi:colicin import membrane protein
VPEVQEQEPEPEPVVEEPTPEPEPEPVPEVQEQEPESEPVIASVPETVVSLDDHLDYAYAEKEAGHVAKAAAAYQQAVERFADDPYVPFLVIELGNLYKEAGAYDVAVNTYRDALSLPVIQGQAGIAEEFQKNIAYLEAVSHITTRHDAPETPFSQIPPDWIAEIEAEFAKQTGN